RGQNHEVIDQVVRPWVAERTVAEVGAVMEKARVPCQKVNSIPDLVNDPHLKARDMLREIDYPGTGKVPVPGIAIKMFKTPGKLYRRAPLAGEHNEEILTTLLGYTADQVQSLNTQGIT
ncbi:MAG: CoA transferase, partial [Chloroflexota bacterium]